ncbi:MAG: hypothetical protein H6722_01715 [Sandaracinus sp.]|nr:hypothetical protein [Sandaracinus sp.]MCB9620794.1 hypothetical protein [Sandaracinus sp.]
MPSYTRVCFVFLVLSLAGFGCGDGGADPEVLAPGCEPLVPATGGFGLGSGEIAAANPVARTFDVTLPPGTRDAIVRATLSFEGYGGSPRFTLLGGGDPTVPIASSRASGGGEEYFTELHLEWAQLRGRTVTVAVDEFLASGEELDYPVPYGIQITYTEVDDCFEENDTAAEARRIAPSGTYSPFSLGHPAATGLREVDDDWFVVDVPVSARGLQLDLAPPPDLMLSIEVYTDPNADPIDTVSGFNPGDALSLRVEASGTLWLRVTDRFAGPAGDAEPFFLGAGDGPNAPHLAMPYRLGVAPL